MSSGLTKNVPQNSGKNLKRYSNTLLLFTLISTSAFSREVSLDLKETISQLTEEKQALSAIGKISVEPGLGLQNVAAEQAFARAAMAMQNEQWLTVMQECQRYLTLSQKPEPQAWMRAQYMLGRSYEERGQASRAARAYLRYLSTFITTDNARYSELSDVLESLVRVGTKGSGRTRAELKQFLSSIAAMQVPAEIQPELKYLTAIGGANIGQKNLALAWLDDLKNSDATADTKARSNLFKALLAIQDSNWISAEAALQSVLATDNISKKTKDTARISLARVYLKLKKPKTALKIYESIPEGSDNYKEALFEHIFACIRENNGVKAKELAQRFLDKFPNHYDATQVRSLRSWLELQSGDLTAAKASILETQNALTDLREKVNTSLQGKVKLSYKDVQMLSQITITEVAIPSDLQNLLNMFEQVSDIQSRLAEIEGVALNALYTIAKVDLEKYSPQLSNRITQLIVIIQNHKRIAEKLVSIEKSRLESDLSKTDIQRTKSSADRRVKLHSRESKLSMDSKRLITWVEPTERLVNLAKTWKRNEAVIASNKNLDAKSNQFDNPRDPVNLRKQMLETLTDIRKIQAGNLVEQSNIKEIQFLFEEFEASILEDYAIFSSYEPNQTKTLDMLDDEDTLNAWELYKQTSKSIREAIIALRTDANNHLNESLSSIDSILSKHKYYKNEFDNLTDILEKSAAKASPDLLAHFDTVIGQRIANQQKWAGDIDYLEYAKKTDEHKSIKKHRELEIQILSDNLRDQESGARQWPR